MKKATVTKEPEDTAEIAYGREGMQIFALVAKFENLPAPDENTTWGSVGDANRAKKLLAEAAFILGMITVAEARDQYGVTL